ncbi:MAG: hypothetical protein DCC49_08770 [Acidobacteria bacterium]|nr:MAG: hypothetical protein DCC49_08770 [Acidobacteriota bacterium]
MFTRILWATRKNNDEGMSLVTVLSMGVVGTLLAISAMSYALGDNSIGAYEREWVRALYSAEAGLNAYLWKMNEDPQYYITDPSMRDPEYFPGELTWTPVPNGEGDYRIKVIPQPKVVGEPLTVTIEASGRVKGVTRTVQVDMERKSFLDWMYFTDFETYNGQNASCLRYQKKSSPCDIRFADGDVLDGPIKSNDFIMVETCDQTTFRSTVESGRGTVYEDDSQADCDVSTPNYEGDVNQCGLTQFCDSVLPISNAKLRQDAENGGYVYWGPIEITPLANGLIRVYSKYGNNGVPPGPAQARTLGDAPPTSTVTDRLPPPNGVIYVGRKTSNPTSLGKAYVGTPHNPQSGWHGQITIGSENSIWVWKSLRLDDESDTSKDVIGLIANESIYVGDDRVRSDRPYWMRRPTNPEIHAAMLALNGDVHAYGITNPPDSTTFSGCSGTLKIVGAFAQKSRGVVALGGTSCGNSTSRGYVKDYVYDSRLGYVQPPRFMEPSNTSWRQLAWREVPPPSA